MAKAQQKKACAADWGNVLPLAASIAGELAATVSKNAIVQGVNESTVALQSVRMAQTILTIAEIADENPSILTGSVGPALDIVEAELKKRQAAAVAPAEVAPATPVEGEEDPFAGLGGGAGEAGETPGGEKTAA